MKTDPKKTTVDERFFHGAGISDQIAIGPAYVLTQEGLQVPEYTLSPGQVENELKRFQTAIQKTQKQLAQLRQKAASLPMGTAEEMTLLLDAHKGILSGSRLVRGVETMIREEKRNAESAVQKQLSAIAAAFAAMKDEYLAARINDIQDVGARLTRNLMQQQYNPFEDAPKGSILISEEISPADAALMNPERIVGFAAQLGGVEGHAAIMARALGLAAILGVAELMDGIHNGDTIIVDGRKGVVIVRPDSETLARYKQEIVKDAREKRRLKSLRDLPSQTEDGVEVSLHANLELAREIESAIDGGAKGVGLLRTEFMFMNRPDLPSEEEQFDTLREFVVKLDGKPLTIRTLDIGGEKLASAFAEAVGESVNPALGLRAIRLGLKIPKLLETQLAAILRASALGKVRILIPMVSSVSQMVLVRECLFQVERRLRRRGVKLPSAIPPVGAMIEIPSAALAADALAKVCDFFAIGSNDLTQYTIAIDRSDDRVADLYNPFHPAVLRLIQVTIAAAWRANIPVSLCGEMASDPAAAPLLLGLGLREFSMSPSRLPSVKQAVMRLSMPQAVRFAENIMAQTDEAEILSLLRLGPGEPAPVPTPFKRKTR